MEERERSEHIQKIDEVGRSLQRTNINSAILVIPKIRENKLNLYWLIAHYNIHSRTLRTFTRIKFLHIILTFHRWVLTHFIVMTMSTLIIN